MGRKVKVPRRISESRSFVSKGEKKWLEKANKFEGSSPWLRAIRNPTTYHLNAARKFCDILVKKIGSSLKVVYVIGSVAAERDELGSDVDIALILEEGALKRQKGNIIDGYFDKRFDFEEIEKAFSRNLGVDFGIYYLADVKAIDNHGKLLYARGDLKGSFPEEVNKGKLGEAQRYESKTRGNTKEAILARIAFQRALTESVAAHMDKFIENLKQAELPWQTRNTELDKKMIGVAELWNHLFELKFSQKPEYHNVFGGYEGVQFILSHNKRIREIIGLDRVPQKQEISKSLQRWLKHREFML